MEGKPIPTLKNHLGSKCSLADRVENGRLVAALIEHPGWAVIEQMAEVVADRGAERLQTIAEETAMTADIQSRIDFARKRGVQDAVSFWPDVVASILESAESAARKLRDSAEMAEEGIDA